MVRELRQNSGKDSVLETKGIVLSCLQSLPEWSAVLVAEGKLSKIRTVKHPLNLVTKNCC